MMNTDPITVFSLGVNSQALSVSRDWNPTIVEKHRSQTLHEYKKTAVVTAKRRKWAKDKKDKS